MEVEMSKNPLRQKAAFKFADPDDDEDTTNPLHLDLPKPRWFVEEVRTYTLLALCECDTIGESARARTRSRTIACACSSSLIRSAALPRPSHHTPLT